MRIGKAGIGAVVEPRDIGSILGNAQSRGIGPQAVNRIGRRGLGLGSVHGEDGEHACETYGEEVALHGFLFFD